MTRIATRDGVAYEVHDVGRGAPLMLLHGFAGSSRSWDALVDGLLVGRRLLMVDLLGHGGSDGPAPARHDITRQAADIAWLIDGLTDGQADLLGYSFGARVSLRVAVDSPDVVRRLVLESPSAGIADAGMRVARVASDERWAALLDEGDLVAFHDAWEAQPLFASRGALATDVRTALRGEHLAANARGLAASLRGAGQGAMEPLHERLPGIDAATLVMTGAVDPVGHARAAEVASLIPGARLDVLDEAGHSPHLERPEVFLRIANDFLSPAIRGEP